MSAYTLVKNANTLSDFNFMGELIAPMDWAKQYIPERKIEWADIYRTVRENVSVEEALSVYSPQTPIRNHRCPCPVHHGEDFNFSFNDHGYTCFVCGSSGDVIDLVKAVCELATREDAVRRINQDMRLNLPLVGEAATGEVSDELKRRRNAAQEKRKAIEEWNRRYNELVDEWAELDKKIRDTTTSLEERAAANERKLYVEYKLDILPPEPR